MWYAGQVWLVVLDLRVEAGEAGVLRLAFCELRFIGIQVCRVAAEVRARQPYAAFNVIVGTLGLQM